MMRSYENGFETADGNTTIPKTRLAERRRRHSANQSDLETLSCRQVDLLHQVLPPEVATALKEDQQLAPERFEDLTIFQSDIVGFTQIASQLHAKEVLESPFPCHIARRCHNSSQLCRFLMLSLIFCRFVSIRPDAGLFPVGYPIQEI